MILLTNDDGIHSAGLKAAYETLVELDEVVIVAPIAQMSAVGRSISIMRPVRIYEMKIDGIKAYAIDGTPTDAVILGIYA
ncbi:MAG: 5'/3'-nucleotidase SurE, partial [Archaeoglobaceae archaeon]